jgi:hypothetical protein
VPSPKPRKFQEQRPPLSEKNMNKEDDPVALFKRDDRRDDKKPSFRMKKSETEGPEESHRMKSSLSEIKCKYAV